MGSMRVPDKPTATVPQHLDGTVVASNGQRSAAVAIDAAFVAVGYVAGLIVATAMIAAAMANATDFDSVNRAVVLSMFISFAVEMAYPIYIFVALYKHGQTPGMKFVGVRWVNFATAELPKGNAIGKRMLEGVIGGITFGIGSLIVCLASQDEHNRHWFDRTCNVIALNIKAGRDPITTPTPKESTSDFEAPSPWNATGSAASSLPPVPPPPVEAVPPVPASSASSMPAVPPPPAEVLPPVPAPPSSAGSSETTPPPGTSTEQFIADVPWAPSGSTTSDNSGWASPAAVSPTSFSAPTASPTPVSPTVPTNFAAPVQSTPTPPMPTPAAAPSTERVTATSQVDDLEHTVAAGRSVVRLTLDDGGTLDLTEQAVVGRDPSADSAHASARPLPLQDPERMISKTHMALSPVHGGVLVEDLHSTNGTSVTLPTGIEEVVLPGKVLVAPYGSVIHCGSRRIAVGQC